MSALIPEYLKNDLGTLRDLRDQLYENLTSCALCPNQCHVDRTKGEVGVCKAPNHLVIGSYAVHPGEEPPISGAKGSGTVFYSHCTLSCLYCQNYPLSQLHHGKKYSTEELCDIYLHLQKQGCHNINMVSCTQYLPFALDSLIQAREKGLTIPIVYNSSGWESEQIVNLLQYFVDIFLVDSRYSNNQTAMSLSAAKSYVEINQQALKQMLQFQPKAIFEKDILLKGVIIRVLVLPGLADESIQVLKNIKRLLGTNVHISLMSQYFPCWKALDHPLINRSINQAEYDVVCQSLNELGFDKGWVQEHEPHDAD